jgi:hypothetical protein
MVGLDESLKLNQTVVILNIPEQKRAMSAVGHERKSMMK